MATQIMSADGALRVGVSGAAGRMGSVTCKAVNEDADLRLLAAIDPAYIGADAMASGGGEAGPQRFTDLASALEAADLQVVVEFSIPAVVKQNVLACLRAKVPVVVGTTGLGIVDLAEIEREADLQDVPVLVAPNFAMGAVLRCSSRAKRLSSWAPVRSWSCITRTSWTRLPGRLA
jgi:4-hydroxy-tetrahydrodipicolinate reductase